MLRSRASFSLLAALVVPSLMACSATTNAPAGGEDPSTKPTGPADTSTPTTPPPSGKPAEPPAKATFSYSEVALPEQNLKVGSIGGSSANDVWMVASPSGSGSNDMWNAYHYDGSTWTTTVLTAATGRPSFGAVSLDGSKAYLGFSYSADVFKLTGAAFTKSASFSVTSGYTMAVVGSTVYVGTQENFGAGPLYTLGYTTGYQQVSGVAQGAGGVVDIWGADENDVWLARSEGLGRLVKGVYEEVDSNPVTAVHGSAKDDVWTISAAGARHFDGSTWTDVALPGGGSDEPRTLNALAKDEVIVTTYSNVYRWDGSAFVKESRPKAPAASVSNVARIGKEAWAVTGTSIHRLAADAKK
jgi:hypothetical protein